MHKPYTFYVALTAAVDYYNHMHHLNRGHLADALGMRGATPAQQLSNALNPNNTQKHLSIAKIDTLLCAMDTQARMVFAEEWLRQWGIKPVLMHPPRDVAVSITAFERVIDDAQMEADEGFRTAKMALRDGALDDGELRAIIKEHTDTRNKADEVIQMAQKRLEARRGAGDE